jgi:hypothetical protein
VQECLPDCSTRFVGDADGIAAAETMVETLLQDGEAAELEIVLNGRCVEVGRMYERCGDVTWQVMGRRRDLR